MNPAAALSRIAPGCDPAAATLLGEGVWGRVFDLADGTVVKLMRQGGGLGDVAELWANEAAALRALECCALPVAVPRLVDAGMLEEAGTGFAAYLRLTRLPGRTLDDDSLPALLTAPGGRFAAQLGEALAALHGLEGAEGFSDPRAGPDRAHLAEMAPRLADIAGPRAIAAIDAGLRELGVAGDTVLSHGDINSTNLLADADGNLCGLIDWAEARRDWREAEFCHLILLEGALAPVRAAYEAASGHLLDDHRLDLVGLHNALIGIVICRRIGEHEEARWNEAQARRLVARLGL